MREVIVSNFINSIDPYLNSIKKVAIVGGSRNEPEIIELEKSKKIVVHTYGIDKDNDIFFDLNVQNEIKNKYDLVLCSQVFEHIYDLKNAIANLVSLLNQESLLWVACPASNRSHGSPNYYSAGYQPELIINLSRDFNLEVLIFGKLGSKRLYFMTHALRVWPNQKELRHPILKYDFTRFSGSKLKNILRFFRDFPGRLYASSLTAEVNDQVEFSTETFVLFKNRSA
jgi:2-polyprenyl-3-methyl-5-hydroxy-6-metoxy-1,4-benzoquinol methylase